MSLHFNQRYNGIAIINNDRGACDLRVFIYMHPFGVEGRRN